jgi:hypothetical protein
MHEAGGQANRAGPMQHMWLQLKSRILTLMSVICHDARSPDTMCFPSANDAHLLYCCR